MLNMHENRINFKQSTNGIHKRFRLFRFLDDKLHKIVDIDGDSWSKKCPKWRSNHITILGRCIYLNLKVLLIHVICIRTNNIATWDEDDVGINYITLLASLGADHFKWISINLFLSSSENVFIWNLVEWQVCLFHATDPNVYVMMHLNIENISNDCATVSIQIFKCIVNMHLPDFHSFNIQRLIFDAQCQFNDLITRILIKI